MTDRARIQTAETTGAKGNLLYRRDVAPGVEWSAIGTRARAHKSADETINNSTTLQNDNHLTMALATGTYQVNGAVFANLAGNSGIKFAFAGTGGLTVTPMNVQVTIWDAGGARDAGRLTALGGTASHGAKGSGDHYAEFAGSLVVTVAGTLTLQWAQLSAVASNLTVQASSTLVLTRIG